ncbi:phosphotransferase enzyme family protein [Mangrovactinospora gilvigrisea]|nr:phosphotransferase [Mangrovactinospora gilvigrisea]
MTGFSDGGAGAALLREHWGLTRVTVSERLQTFPSRFVERIQADQGSFAVKVDQEPGTMVEGSDQVQAGVAALLPRHVPTIIPDRTACLWAIDQGRRITVHEDIDGGHPASDQSTWSRLGTLLARMHALPHAPRAFAIPVAVAADELDRLAGDYPFCEDFRALLPRVRLIDDEPAATIHGEVNLSNVRQRTTGELVLLDWDAAGAGPIALDLGYPLICVFHDEDLTWHGEHARAFYTAYAASRATILPPPEQIFNAALMHAMRYLRFANPAARWTRIRHVIDHERDLVDLLAHTLR